MNELAPRALFGGALAGDRIVRLVFMDEAGISNPKQEPYVVVVGVIVDADKKLVALERRIDTLIERFIPEEHQEGFVFQAKELFNGGGKVFKRGVWPLAKRLEIANCLAEIPRKLRLPIAAGYVQRANFPKSFDGSAMSTSEKTLGAHLVAFVNCAMEVELWMRQHTKDEVCLLVVENNDDARKLITDTQTVHRDPNQLLKIHDGKIPEKPARVFPLKKIKEAPLFATKTQSKALQIADFCAYVFKKQLMGDARYQSLFNLLQVQHVMDYEKGPWETRKV